MSIDRRVWSVSNLDDLRSRWDMVHWHRHGLPSRMVYENGCLIFFKSGWYVQCGAKTWCGAGVWMGCSGIGLVGVIFSWVDFIGRVGGTKGKGYECFGRVRVTAELFTMCPDP